MLRCLETALEYSCAVCLLRAPLCHGRSSRIMAKWGFAGEGSGLGRAQQGAAEPIRAVQRPKNRGLGAE